MNKITLKNIAHTYFIKEVSILFLLSVLFLFFASTWTSPFYSYCLGDDSSFYSMVGRGILHGYVPYKNFFDLKGPYLFFIQSFGQFISRGKLGIFLFQIPFCFAAILHVWKIARLFLNYKKACIVMGFFLLVYTATLWGGNTAEEYSLPFSMICLYYTCLWILHKDIDKLSKYACTFGLSTGIMVFMKITLTAPIFAMILCILFLLIREKAYFQILSSIGSFLFGFFISLFPVVIYFSYHGAIEDLIYQEFIFGFLRGTDYGESFNLLWELKLSAFYVVFFFALFQKSLKAPFRILLFTMSVIGYIFLHLGTPFIYYFTSTLPVFVLGLSLFLQLNDPFVITLKLSFLIPLLAFFVFSGFYVGEALNRIGDCIDAKTNPYYQNYYEQSLELCSLIPEQERQSIYCLESSCTWFEINQVLPAYKYQINLPFFIALDPSIEWDLYYYFLNNQAKWLVTSPLEDLDIPDSIKDVVRYRYELITFNDFHELYTLRR